MFYKIETAGLPAYLFRLIPNAIHSYQTKTLNNVNTYQYVEQKHLNHLCFLWSIIEWNSLIYAIVVHLAQLSKNI